MTRNKLTLGVYGAVIVLFLGCAHQPPITSPKSLPENYLSPCASAPSLLGKNPEECNSFIDECCVLLAKGEDRRFEMKIENGLLKFPECRALQWLKMEYLLADSDFYGILPMLKHWQHDESDTSDVRDRITEITLRVKTEIKKQIMHDFRNNDYTNVLASLAEFELSFPLDEHLEEIYLKSLLNTSGAESVIKFYEDRKKVYPEDILVIFANAYEIEDRHADAAKIYKKLISKTGKEVYRIKYVTARDKSQVKGTPHEIQTIENQPWVTRSELATLLVKNFDIEPLVEILPVITDINDNWAKNAILIVCGSEIMNVGRDHEFNPNSRIRKMDLARIGYKLADKFNLPLHLEREIIPWDVPPEHFAISEIKWVLAAQLMHLNNNGAFLAGEWMTGNEVMDFIHRFHTFQNYFNE